MTYFFILLLCQLAIVMVVNIKVMDSLCREDYDKFLAEECPHADLIDAEKVWDTWIRPMSYTIFVGFWVLNVRSDMWDIFEPLMPPILALLVLVGVSVVITRFVNKQQNQALDQPPEVTRVYEDNRVAVYRVFDHVQYPSYSVLPNQSN